MGKKLLDAEWIILRAMWGKQPQTMKEIIASVQEERPDVLWQYKTYHSYLRNMCKKGLIGCEDKNLRDKYYFTIISRKQALRQESEALLTRISVESMSILVAMLAENEQFSASDKKELLDLSIKLEQSEDGDIRDK